MHGLLEDRHKSGLHLLALLVSCMSSAALRHHFIKHNNVLRRMWFGRRLVT